MQNNRHDEAIALLLSPSNAAVVSESGYWKRDSTQEFVIEAVMTLPEVTGIGSQHNFSWPWAWNGQDAAAPSASEDDDLPAPDDPVYRVRVRGTTELELVWEIVQPHDDADHVSVAVRRKIGLVRLSADERNNRDLRLRVDEEVALFVYSEPPAPTPFASGWSSTELNHERNDG